MYKAIFKTVGTNFLRVGALERVTGEALFAGDLHMEGVITLVALRSDRPHARVVNIDLAPGPGNTRLHPNIHSE